MGFNVDSYQQSTKNVFVEKPPRCWLPKGFLKKAAPISDSQFSDSRQSQKGDNHASI